jgi:hypothetical protein
MLRLCGHIAMMQRPYTVLRMAPLSGTMHTHGVTSNSHLTLTLRAGAHHTRSHHRTHIPTPTHITTHQSQGHFHFFTLTCTAHTLNLRYTHNLAHTHTRPGTHPHTPTPTPAAGPGTHGHTPTPTPAAGPVFSISGHRTGCEWLGGTCQTSRDCRPCETGR